VNIQIVPAPVRKSIVVKAAPERAFAVFTAGMGRWWKKEHHLGKSPLTDVVLEPREGGRWYEVNEDESTCEWGKVLAWEPPRRVLLAWQIDADWQYDPSFVTELEIRFTPDGNRTRVDLEHRNLDRYGDKAESIRAMLDSSDGWDLGMAAYAAAVLGAVQPPEI
jgi:uncharacterized protein YndB with AHSA1/START domain